MRIYVPRDPRSPDVPVNTQAGMHADDVTALRFSPAGNVLLSGGADGQLCLVDPRVADEDDAILASANWGPSIARCGWLVDGKQTWAHSDMETFTVWSDEVLCHVLELTYADAV